MNHLLSLFTQAKSNIDEKNEFDDALNNQDDLKDVESFVLEETKVDLDALEKASETGGETEEVSEFEEEKDEKPQPSFTGGHLPDDLRARVYSYLSLTDLLGIPLKLSKKERTILGNTNPLVNQTLAWTLPPNNTGKKEPR